MSSTSDSVTYSLRALLRIALSCLLIALSSGAQAEALRVTLIPSHEDGAHQRVIDAIRERVRQDAPGRVSLQTVSLQDYRQHATEIGGNAGLLVPIGMQATRIVAGNSGGAKVLAVLVPRSGLGASFRKGLAEGSAPAPKSLSAIVLDQPVARQLGLIRLLFGEHGRIGIPLGPYSLRLQAEIEQAAARLNLAHDTETIDSAEELMPRISRLLDRSDILLTLPDPELFNRQTVRYILLGSYRKRVPVIGFSRSYVKAGALAAAYSTPRQIGRQAGEVIMALQTDPARPLPPLMEPAYFSVAINQRVAHAFGLGRLSEEKLTHELIRLEAEER